MAYIHIKDSLGNILSEGDGLNPLVVGPLNASIDEESAPIELIVYTDTDYKTYGDTVISFTGTTADKWTIADTSTGTYGSTLTISSEVLETGTSFYVKAQATSDENPVNDETVDIQVQAEIQAV